MSARMNKDPRARGRRAERVAREFLTTRGLQPLCESYHFRGGEIDLIMRDGDTIVFVEVRYRNNADFGSGAESITARKQKRVIATAMHYLQHMESNANPPCRFDVIAVSDEMHSNDVEWIPDAFDAR